MALQCSVRTGERGPLIRRSVRGSETAHPSSGALLRLESGVGQTPAKHVHAGRSTKLRTRAFRRAQLGWRTSTSSPSQPNPVIFDSDSFLSDGDAPCWVIPLMPARTVGQPGMRRTAGFSIAFPPVGSPFSAAVTVARLQTRRSSLGARANVRRGYVRQAHGQSRGDRCHICTPLVRIVRRIHFVE